MYYFEAYQSWKLDDSIFSSFVEPEKLRFSCIQLSSNVNLFLLNSSKKMEDGDIEERSFMFGSFSDVLSFIELNNIYKSKISIISPRYENDGKYVMSDIVEVIQAKDSSNSIAHIYCCKNNKRYVDSIIDDNESGLSEFKTIYKTKIE